ETVAAVGKPTILVVVSGSPLDLTWAHDSDHVAAIVQAFYPGEETGTALAEVLFGDHSPAGRLPITFPRSVNDLPDFADYAMRGPPSRSLEKPPLYPFGYGLSYTRFVYRDPALSRTRLAVGEPLELAVTVENAGERAGDEVVQLYVRDLEASCPVPHH